MRGATRSLVVALLAGILAAGCRARHETTPTEARLRAREAFLASASTRGLLDRLAALGCEAGAWGLVRWPIGVTVEAGRVGMAIVENLPCGPDRAAELVLTATGDDDAGAPRVVAGAAVVDEAMTGADPVLLLSDRSGALREVALTPEVSAEIDRALGEARAPDTDAAVAALLGAEDLDRVAGACRRAFRRFDHEDLLVAEASGVPTRGDCASCLSDVAQCLGVIDRLAEAHNACMATLYCANGADAARVTEALGGQSFGSFGDDEIERWFGGPADCAAVGTDDDDLAYCANLYVQGGAAPRTWDHPTASCEAPFFDYDEPPDWSGACATRSRCFSTSATGGTCTAPVDGVVYWTQLTHRGADCAGPVGTELFAMGPGRAHVHAANYPGQVVIIDHELTPAEATALGVTADADGRFVLHSMYGHVAAEVAEGQLVEPGQLIATIVNHPDADEHVHWETQTVEHFDCPGPDGTDSAYGPGYEHAGRPTRTGGDWMNPTATLGTLVEVNATLTSTPAEGFDTLQDWLARATASEGLTRTDVATALEDGTLFVPTEGALAGVFALTDLEAARDAGYFANFAALQRYRSSYLGGGPGTQFYCAVEMDLMYSCHLPLCFGEPAGTTTDEVTSGCFEIALTCDDPTASCGADVAPISGCCPHLLAARLAPSPSDLSFERPAGGWTTTSWAYWPNAAVPEGVACAYVLPDDPNNPAGEGTYMPSTYVVGGAEAAETACTVP